MSEKQTESMSRWEKCFYHEIGSFDQIQQGHIYFCVPKDAKTLGERCKMKQEIDPAGCENCQRFKSRYIEYPLVINGIHKEDPSPWGVMLKPVKIRPCSEDKTYFGIYLGEFPRYMHVSYNEKSGILDVSTPCNPCIYVPALEKVVFGDESWWSEINPGEDVTDITDEQIEDQWYMKMLRGIEK